MGIVDIAGYHMPMDVWYGISQTGQVHLVRRQQRTKRLLKREDNPHQVLSVGLIQVAEFAFVRPPHHPA